MWNRTGSRAEELIHKLKCADPAERHLCCDTVKEACSDADIICTVTSSEDPVLFKEHVKPGQWYLQYL